MGRTRQRPKLPFTRQRKKGQAARRPARKPLLKTVACIAVFACLCIPAVFANTLPAYLPALFFPLLIATDFAYCQISKNRLVFAEVASAKTCMRGESIDMTIRLKNRSPLPIARVDVVFSQNDLFGEDCLITRQSIVVPPNSMQDIHFPLQLMHLGEFVVGLKELEVHDLLGLFTASVPVGQEECILVTPRLRTLQDLHLTDITSMEAPDALQPKSVDGSDYFGVREYAFGDPLKTIHWKLSARAGDYLTKIFEEHAEPRLHVYLDFSVPEYTNDQLMEVYDQAIETALSIEALACKRGLETCLVFLNKHEEPDRFVMRHDMDFRDLMMRIPRIAEGDPRKFSNMLVKQGTSPHSADNIAICSASLTSELVEGVSLVRHSKRNASLFALVPHELEDEKRDELLRPLRTLQAQSIPCFIVDQAEREDEIREGGLR